MFASVRKYQDATSIDEIRKRAEEEFLPMMRKLSGFQGYYAIDCVDNCLVTITLFDTRESALASNDQAREWVRERLAGLLPVATEALSGEVIIVAAGGAGQAAA